MYVFPLCADLSRPIEHLEDRKIYDVYYWEEARTHPLDAGWAAATQELHRLYTQTEESVQS